MTPGSTDPSSLFGDRQSAALNVVYRGEQRTKCHRLGMVELDQAASVRSVRTIGRGAQGLYLRA